MEKQTQQQSILDTVLDMILDTMTQQGRQLPTRDERRQLAEGVAQYTDYLERVQRMPLLVRLAMMRVTVLVYDYLRRCRQLGRRTGAFDDDVKARLHGVMDEYRKRVVDSNEP